MRRPLLTVDPRESQSKLALRLIAKAPETQPREASSGTQASGRALFAVREGLRGRVHRLKP